MSKTAKRSFQIATGRLQPAFLPEAPRATAPTPAPGVIQMNFLDASHMVWFVNTETLPTDTVIWPFLVFPDGTELPLDGLRMMEDIPPGASFDLPNIRQFSDFWPEGLLTYGVVITMSGRDSQVAADVPANYARSYDDVSVMIPRITSAAESVSDSDVILTVRGVFGSDMPYLVLDDIVVPRSAIQLVSGEIHVNLSRVRGLDLASMREFLLTVAQGGWSDTAVFRHTPERPGSYNPAPN